MADDETFEKGASGASLTYPMQCSALRRGGHVMIKGHPCKIVDMSTSKTGKHGHAKVHIVALDIFTNNKYEENCPSTHNIDVPRVDRKDYSITDISDDGFLSLMDDNMDVREDIQFDAKFCEPKEKTKDKEFPWTVDLIEKLLEDEALQAQVLGANNMEKVINIRIAKK